VDIVDTVKRKERGSSGPKLSERIVCFIEQSFLLLGSEGWPPIINHYSCRVLDQLCDTDGHEGRRRTQAAEMQKRRAKIPDPEHVIDSTTNLLNEGF